MLAYTKFTFKEFRVCVRAIFAFAGGYKLGERYLLDELERRHGQSADPEAWKLDTSSAPSGMSRRTDAGRHTDTPDARTRRRRRPDLAGRHPARHDGERARRVPPQAATRATTRRARPEPGRRQEQPGRSQPIRPRLRTLGRPLRAPSNFFRRNVVLSFQEDAIGIRLSRGWRNKPGSPKPIAAATSGVISRFFSRSAGKRKAHVGAMALSDFTFRSVAVEETTLLYRLNRYARGRVPARAGGVRRLPQDYEKGQLTSNV